jgi:hypothetical protein
MSSEGENSKDKQTESVLMEEARPLAYTARIAAVMRIMPKIMKASRGMAYTSEVGESFRPVLPSWAVKSLYAGLMFNQLTFKFLGLTSLQTLVSKLTMQKNLEKKQCSTLHLTTQSSIHLLQCSYLLQQFIKLFTILELSSKKSKLLQNTLQSLRDSGRKISFIFYFSEFLSLFTQLIMDLNGSWINLSENYTDIKFHVQKHIISEMEIYKNQ